MAVTGLHAPGLSKLRRDLTRIDKRLGQEATRHIRSIAAKVKIDARVRAPRRTGRLSRSIRHSVRSKGASIYSNLEYAPVQHWGGTIRPRGVPIQIKPSLYLTTAAEQNMRNVENELAGILDHIADSFGFH